MTPRMRIELESGDDGLRPGDEVVGRVDWLILEPPQEVELRLFWFTSGRGTQDVEVVERVSFTPQPEGSLPFRFRLPPGPFSFSGQLISISWALELVIEPGSHTERAPLVVGPAGREIQLDQESDASA